MVPDGWRGGASRRKGAGVNFSLGKKFASGLGRSTKYLFFVLVIIVEAQLPAFSRVRSQEDCRVKTIGDRRKSPRFDLRLPLRYRVSQKGVENRWSTGITRDMSKDGVVFKTRHPLPVGGHIELRIDWPARYQSIYPIDLQVTGFIIRNE